MQFNPADGTNQVAVSGGALISNMPLLNYSPGAIRQGDAVLLARIGNGYVIIGSLVQPGSARFGSGVDSMHWGSDIITGFTGSGATISDTRPVPSWALSFMVFAVGTATVETANPGAAGVLGVQCTYLFTDQNGNSSFNNTAGYGTSVPANGQYGEATAAMAQGNFCQPGSSVTVGLDVYQTPPTLIAASSTASLSYMIMFFNRQFIPS